MISDLRVKARKKGTSSIADEAENLKRDPAAKWLAKHSSNASGKKKKAKKAKARKPEVESIPDGAMIHIYTDGACEPNPGAGGWAFVVFDRSQEVNNRNGGSRYTTNNIMEMTAILAALEYAVFSGLDATKTLIYSDSQYCVKGCMSWRHKWKQDGWKRGQKPLANDGLWMAIDAAHDAFPCKIVWVRGHSGVPGNERADRLAAKGRKYALEHYHTPFLASAG